MHLNIWPDHLPFMQKRRDIECIKQRGFFLICSMLFSCFLHSSPQVPDFIVYKGDTSRFYPLLIEGYIENFKQNGEKEKGDLFGLKFRDGAGFNCWRGYQALFAIENDSLFLKVIISCGEVFRNDSTNKANSIKKIHELFGNDVNASRLFVDWYSGELIIPKGERLRWDGVFYETTTSEVRVTVDYGQIMNETIYQNYEDDPSLIDRHYRDTFYFQSQILLAKINKRKIEQFDECLSYSLTVDSQGYVIKVFPRRWMRKYRDFGPPKGYRFLRRQLKEEIEAFQFDVILQRGLPISERLWLCIALEKDRFRVEIN